MLTLSSEQYDQIWLAQIRGVEDRIAAHLRKYVPGHSEYLGDSRLRRAIRATILAGQAHGFRTERSLAIYACLAMMFGHEFVDDLQYPWARTIVDSAQPDNERARALYDRAMEEADRFNGSHDLEYRRAVQRARDFDPSALPEEAGRDDRSVIEFLRMLHPSKCDALGAAVLHQFVATHRSSARKLRLRPPFGVCLHVALCLYLGSGYASDPFHPWANECFAGPGGQLSCRPESLHTSVRELIDTTQASSSDPTPE